MLPSQRFTSDFDQENALAFYRSLRSINPSPFLFYIKFADFCLNGSSPEIMVSVKNKKVTVRPLAGTRKRGANALEDKNIAELVILLFYFIYIKQIFLNDIECNNRINT